jgi:hypothetical protein
VFARVRFDADAGVQDVERGIYAVTTDSQDKFALLAARRETQREKTRLRAKAWREAYRAKNPDGYREEIRIRSAAYRAAHPERVAEYHRRARVKNPEKYREVNRKARGLPTPTSQCPVKCENLQCAREAACLDHEHLTWTFRGWLCIPCNFSLTKHHTPATLRGLADYLEQRS